MANEKQISSRIQHKHDIEANWHVAGTATKPFIPKAGELIIYDPDDIYENVRTKIGDGKTPVHLLPWASGCDESVGLEFELNEENNAYRILGYEDFVGEDIIIPRGYNGLAVKEIYDLAFANTCGIKSIVIPKSVTKIGANAIYDSISGPISIYCEVEAQPEDWNETWNYDNYPVIWGFANNFQTLNNKLGDTTVLNTESKEVVGAINELNDKTIDRNKLVGLDTYDYNGRPSFVEINAKGILWDDTFALTDENGNPFSSGESFNRVPIVAGDNVTLTYDEDGTVVKINSTNGVDAITSIDTNLNSPTETTTDNGIGWRNRFEIETEKGLYYGDIFHCIPLVAGDNVTFTVDEENQVVKINATGDGSGGTEYTAGANITFIDNSGITEINAGNYTSNLRYTFFESGPYYYVDYDGDMTNTYTPLYLPGIYNGYPTIIVGNYTSGHCSVANVQIGEGALEISAGAFIDCYSLERVSLPNTISYIGSAAFYDCVALRDINIPNSVNTIGANAFEGCYNLNILIPSTVYTVYENAFTGCSGATICLEMDESTAESTWGFVPSQAWPEATIIYDAATNLVKVNEKLNNFDSSSNGNSADLSDYQKKYDETLNVADNTIVGAIQDIDNRTVDKISYFTLSSPHSISLEDDGLYWVQEASIRTADGSYYNLGYMDFTAPVRYGYNIAFSEASDGIYEISTGSYTSGLAFDQGIVHGNTKTFLQEEVIIPEIYNNYYINEVRAEGFAGASMTRVKLPDSIEYIQSGAFQSCTHLENINLPHKLKEIGQDAFRGCASLKEIIIPSSVLSIGMDAFANCATNCTIYYEGSGYTSGVGFETNWSGTATVIFDAATNFAKVNSKLGDIESGLGELHAAAQAIIGGTT